MQRMTHSDEKSSTQEIEKLLSKLKELLLNDWRRERIIEYYKNDSTYLKQIIRALELEIKAEPSKIYEIVKTPRAGYTTNYILAALFLNKKNMVVVPANLISINTVTEAGLIYERITGDTSKIIRTIPSNAIGCLNIWNQKGDTEASPVLPIFSDINCSECDAKAFELELTNRKYPLTLPITNGNFCQIKTMMKEEKKHNKEKLKYSPDIISITYDKLKYLSFSSEKNDLFNRLIDNREGILFDEFGKFIQSNSDSVIISGVSTDKEGDVKWKTDIETEVLRIRKYIENKNTLDKLTKENLKFFINTYIQPIVKIYDRIMNTELPYLHDNPLAYQMINIKVHDRPKTVLKNKALQYKFRENVELFKNLFGDVEGFEHAVFLFKLTNILMGEDFIAKKEHGKPFEYQVEFETKFAHTELVAITMPNYKLMELFESVVQPHQITVVSDATMPNISIDNVRGKKHVRKVFGDLAEINKMSKVFQYKCKKFSSYSWEIDTTGEHEKYWTNILDILFHKIDIGTAFLIVPNKEVYEDLLRKYNDIAVGSDIEDPPDDKLIITYYNSKISRGVECNRRIGISLGAARKPMDAYKAIVLGQGKLYGYANKSALKLFAKKEGLSVKKFKSLIDDFSKPHPHPTTGKLFRSKSVPDVLQGWYEYQCESLQLDITAQDTCQGITRCKDPEGKPRSAQIFIGVTDGDLINIMNWGADTTYHVGKKHFVNNQFRIPASRMLQIDDFDKVVKWLNGEDVIEEHHLGFNLDFPSALFMALIEKDNSIMSQSEVWANLSRNLRLGYDSENHRNGYLMGTIKIFEKEITETHGFLLKKTGNQHKFTYNFSINPKPKLPKEVILSDVEKNALKILLSAFISKVSEFTLNTAIKNQLTLSENEIIEALKYIHKNDILAGSSWNTVKDHGNLKAPKIVKGVR